MNEKRIATIEVEVDVLLAEALKLSKENHALRAKKKAVKEKIKTLMAERSMLIKTRNMTPDEIKALQALRT